MSEEVKPWSPCDHCGKRPHKTMRDAEHAAKVMYHKHRNEKRIWQPYKCRCGSFLTGTTAESDKDLLYGRMNRRVKWRQYLGDQPDDEREITDGPFP